MLSEFDQRQLGQMKLLIHLLEDRQINAAKFVSDQWTLTEMLQTIESSWREKYFSLVNEIEDLYASAIDRGEKQMSQKDVDIIDKNLQQMRMLIESIEKS